MNELKNTTRYLFECDYFADEFDANDSYEHYDRAQMLMKEYKWCEIFEEWFKYLLENCKTPKEVINFVNLFSYYGGQDQAIRDPYDFIGYIYYRVDMDQYWDEAGELFEGVTITILENCGKINTVKNPYYSPDKDPELIASIQRWRNK